MLKIKLSLVQALHHQAIYPAPTSRRFLISGYFVFRVSDLGFGGENIKLVWTIDRMMWATESYVYPEHTLMSRWRSLLQHLRYQLTLRFEACGAEPHGAPYLSLSVTASSSGSHLAVHAFHPPSEHPATFFSLQLASPAVGHTLFKVMPQSLLPLCKPKPLAETTAKQQKSCHPSHKHINPMVLPQERKGM